MTSPSGTERDKDCLVTVESETHEGEWLRMVACPIPHCNAVMGKEYERFSAHLSSEHGPEDVGLSPGGRRVATDGGTSVDGSGQDGCPYCGDTSAPITSHYPPFCNLYHKEKFQEQIRYDEPESDRDD